MFYGKKKTKYKIYVFEKKFNNIYLLNNILDM